MVLTISIQTLSIQPLVCITFISTTNIITDNYSNFKVTLLTPAFVKGHDNQTNVQHFLPIFFVEFLVELDVTSTGCCIALRCVAFCCLPRIALCCVVVM